MKLKNLPLIRKRMAILGVTTFAAAGAAHAQFTGIGTTAPAATLHVTPVNATDEVLQVDGVIDLTTETSYSDVLVHDPTTGLFRRESITDLLSNNGEFVFNGSSEIVPRRAGYETNLVIGAAALSIGVPTSITGNTDVTGNLTVTDVANVAGASITGTTEILIQQTGADLIEHVTVTDLISNASYWSFSGGVLAPADAAVAGTMEITATGVDIVGATTLDGTLSVDQASITDANTPTAVDGTEHVLIQENGSDLVQHVTINDMLSNASYWAFDATLTTLTPSDADLNGDFTVSDGAVEVDGTLNATGNVDFDANANVDGTLSVTSTATFVANASVGTTLDIGQVDPITTPLVGDERILIQGATGTLVNHVTVDELVENSGFWQWTDATETAIQPADFAGSVVVDATTVAIGQATTVAGTVDISGATTIGTATTNADLTVNGNGTITGNSNTGGTLQIGTVAQVAAADLIGTDEVLIQQAGTDLVEYVTIDDLLSSSGEWVYDATNTRIYARRAQAGGSDVWVTDAGNHVVEVTASYQFGDATNQVTATGITSSTGYALNTADAQDVSFTETGAGAPWLYHDADAGDGSIGRVGINTNAPAATLHVAGNIVASNSTVTSDRRFKRDIENFSGALEAVKALRGVSYSFRADEFPSENFDEAEHLGFIAQEIREILPQTVVERGDGYLTVDYAAVTPVLAEAVEELAAKVEALEAENASLKASPAVGTADVIAKLEARIAALDARLDDVAGRK